MKIRTLIIDDSVLYRTLVSEVVAQFPDVEVAGVASSGEEALRKMEQAAADLVFCDVHLPGKTGVDVLIEIRKRYPSVTVVMMSGISNRNAEIVIKALEHGALDFFRKPENGTAEENRAHLSGEITMVLNLVRIRRNIGAIAGAPKPEPAVARVPFPPKAVPTAPVPERYSIAAIGVSTGGPEALSKLVPKLPAALPVPVLLVQHMPSGFTRSLSESLQKKSQIRVVEAEEGTAIVPGTVYIAPGGRHMILRRSERAMVIGLNDGPHENGCRPSVDVLFRSVAATVGSEGILAMVLTGMGSDGLNGVRAMKRKGCYCITQAQTSCVVYGMPKAIDDAGLSDKSLSIDDIAFEVCKKLKCI